MNETVEQLKLRDQLQHGDFLKNMLVVTGEAAGGDPVANMLLVSGVRGDGTIAAWKPGTDTGDGGDAPLVFAYADTGLWRRATGEEWELYDAQFPDGGGW